MCQSFCVLSIVEIEKISLRKVTNIAKRNYRLPKNCKFSKIPKISVFVEI